MAQQIGQQDVDASHTRLNTFFPYADPNRQRIDEQPHHTVRTFPTLHAPKQDRAKDYVLSTRGLPHHSRTR